ncbi:IncP-type conjugal transfer protein TrbI (plasmid) [Bradyrhizobium sp. YCK136]|jgi:type IV secretion system protein VirB10|uniref:Conjugal transfer protein TrbI n=1 Tax=Bradyrhizobium diazoefficiens TaxID=1355477 RepID=A0A0E4BYP8_9BRAD|nr:MULTISPECIES: IncP-type conjugal transfer protein TrbI [Bradyrhizobium]BAR63394.1 conjugal transfer protein TrbI [Bradyrhizobium diazoefficiens]MBR0883369.1 IncP-type conjugal transfer protein TrbI [Bradyrhizobium liaoningense]MBR0945719.1 IncP-type conjugal transfer protein TrbI [Bradyrhizobium liaoningense]MBR1002649.1 IncP-type conjugal transfer protein TrbI [Bradyrhizobium liaoningense]MBR1032972.1 IncP-type conjugal transfer protein TrbI [Bradyrhizobium liaoningense]
MTQSLQLGGGPGGTGAPKDIRRLNRLPIIAAAVLGILFLAVIFYGLTSRGLVFRSTSDAGTGGGAPATTFADQMKRGVADGIIGDGQQSPPTAPAPEPRPAPQNPFVQPQPAVAEPRGGALESEEAWRARLAREGQEQFLREQQRQRRARLQASNIALDSPLAIDTQKIKATTAATSPAKPGATSAAASSSPADLYSLALLTGLNGQNLDPNGQAKKENFFNSDLAKLGYLPNQVVPPRSYYELKRGSVIPATLITGINSDLPGRITAQVSQNVYDSATGHRLLIPQGTKLMGRYDSKISFGQSRVLVIWTDIIFPNGSTLQIGGMAGTDAEGYGGFTDQVDNHYFKTFGSAILLAIIGTGIDMAAPQSSTLATQQTASDAARRNFAETFGRVAERTINKNLDVQPTLEIRPGYQFNVLVDQDIVFPGAYRG